MTTADRPGRLPVLTTDTQRANNGTAPLLYRAGCPMRTYEAWVSSSTVIAPTKAMEIHPVVAGHYRLIIETPEFVSRNAGRFLEVEPGQHIRYTWERNGDGETSENRRHIFSGGRGNQSYHHSLRIRENRKS